MVTSEQRLDYLKHRIKYNCIGGLLGLPMLVLIYWLGYHYAFFLVLALEIMNGIGMGMWISEQEALLGLEY